MALVREVLERPIAPPGATPGLDALVMRLLERELSARTSNGAALRAEALALTGEAAPYPEGKQALAAAVEAAMRALRSEPTTAPREVAPAARRNADAPTEPAMMKP